MIRFYKFKYTDGFGNTVCDPNLLTISGLPEYTLEKGNIGWTLYRNGRYVQSFADTKAARNYLTEMVNGK